MSKYDPLSHGLRRQRNSHIPATFSQIEAILQFGLPKTARARSQWWENNATRHSHARAWLDAGFLTKEVSTAAETVTFVRSSAAGVAWRGPKTTSFGEVKNAGRLAALRGAAAALHQKQGEVRGERLGGKLAHH